MKHNKIFLITSFSLDTNRLKLDEYLYCLKKNIKNKFINKIHILLEERNDLNLDFKNQLEKSDKIKLCTIETRPSFRSLFVYANQNLKKKKVIVANADIYFDHSLELVANYNFHKKFFVLTRWNVSDDNKVYLQGRRNPFYPWKKTEKSDYIKDPSLRNIKSADCWLFTTPLKMDFECHIEIGKYKCDSLLNCSLLNSSYYRVYNPCFSIKAFHYDMNIYHRDKDFYIKDDNNKKGCGIPWCNLEDTLS